MLSLAADLLVTVARRAAHARAETEAVPLNGVSDAQWIGFVRACTSGDARTVTPSCRLGMFGLTVRRLCDLGAMERPRLVELRGSKVWSADWRRPATLADFLDDSFVQYSYFAESIRRYAACEEIVSFAGRDVDGARASLSGLLAVAHRAGQAGLSKWVVRPAERRKFQTTTEHFRRANELF
jgi:hypothetical protein